MPLHPYLILNGDTGANQDDEWVRLGAEAHLANKLPDAQRHYMHALRLNPQNITATQNLGLVYAQSNLFNEGILTLERATLIGSDDFPGMEMIWSNYALMLFDADRLDDALVAAKKAMSIKATQVTRIILALMLSSAGYPDQSLEVYKQILDEDPKHGAASLNACFVQALMSETPADLLKMRKRWHDANAYKGPIPPHKNDKNPDRVLRVGYIGGDFKRHSAAMIFGSVVLKHDPKNVEVFLYSSLPVDPASDLLTKAFRDKAGANWRDIATTPDEEVVAMIRKDQIDILVDLAAHSNGGRLSVLTHKPAPIQVTAWGLAHGTGCPEVDYFFADPVVIPANERQHFAEKIYDLPCVVSFIPPLEYNLRGVSSLPYYHRDHITFGCYSRYEKISDKCLATFQEVLKRVPNAKLEFKDHSLRRPYSIRRILKAMPDIDPRRLMFSISTTHPDHMLAYQQADLILDPFPHSGGVVCLEQVWMGVPIVTLYGTQPSGRTTSSVLTVLGHADWIAKTPAEYVDIAARMAEDTDYLARVRKTLREDFMNSAVIVGYCGKVEEAYRAMWKEWINK